MAIEDAIAALPRYWTDVIARFGPERSRELHGLVAGIDGPEHDRVISQIADLLIEGLPPGHPIQHALMEGDLYESVTPDWPMITDALRREVGLTLLSGQPPGRADDEPSLGAADREQDPGQPGGELRPGESILRSVADRLLQAPALTAEQVRQRGGDPADPGLIRLERADGSQQWPAFQFDPRGGPRSVIRQVNELLGAAADPFAAADWWLSRNSWLGSEPSLLIDRVPDDYLVRAARAVGSEV